MFEELVLAVFVMWLALLLQLWLVNQNLYRIQKMFVSWQKQDENYHKKTLRRMK